jgi:hypothetical protein
MPHHFFGSACHAYPPWAVSQLWGRGKRAPELAGLVQGRNATAIRAYFTTTPYQQQLVCFVLMGKDTFGRALKCND